MNERNMVEQGFYQRCGEAIGVYHNYKIPNRYKTRWNNRDPGNGRFPGWGLIRRYSSKNIHVCHAGNTKLFKSEDAVMNYLKGED